VRSEGIASDGVADIAFETASGTLVAVTAVVDNVYSVKSVPKMYVTGIVARDRSGAVIWTEAFPPLALPN
jgi:hypothetical protein